MGGHKMSYNELVYGKNSTERIVSVEAVDGYYILFQELEDGTINQIPHKSNYWVLTNELIPKFKKGGKLAGNLHYQYGYQFEERSLYMWARRYLKEANKDFYSVWHPKESMLLKDGITYYKGMQLQDVSLLSFDIETTSLKYEDNGKVLLISNTYRRGTTIIHKLFAYDEYKSEGEMLKAWCDWVREVNPSIMLGHNIFSYDLPYLRAAAEANDIELNLGRDGSAITFEQFESKFRKDQQQFLLYNKIHCFGRELVDTYFLSIKFDVATKKYDSYKLKSIIAVEGLEDKNRVFYDADKIRYNYKDPVEFAKIKQYCITDSDDALKLYDLMAPSIFYFCQSVPKPFQLMIESATGSQMNSLFVRSYLQKAHSIPKADPAYKFPGAISWGGNGIYSNCLKWDVSSLYPSIMLQYEIYPDLKDPDKNFLKILEFFTIERLKNKKTAEEQRSKYHKDLSDSQKVAINSAYGMMGASGLNFNNPAGAAKVTEIGRDILQKSIIWATGKKYKDWNPEFDMLELEQPEEIDTDGL